MCAALCVGQGEEVKINDLIRGDVAWSTDTLGDFVVLRSNGMPVYNFCVAIDDALMGITHVLRWGQGWEAFGRGGGEMRDGGAGPS